MILQYITGYKIPFDKPIVQTIEPKNPNFSQSEIDRLTIAISELSQSGAVVKCDRVKDQFISPIFLIPKPDGSFRFILNLKSLNKSIVTNHFKMEDIRTACKLLSKDGFMANIDLKEAYFLCPIHKDFRKYLRFKFLDQIYEFQCLPFGLSSAPYVFTKLMKPIGTYLRNKGYLVVLYLDDLLLIGNTYNDCKNCVQETVGLLQRLGFVINFDKSSLVPHKTQKFLGFELNSHSMCLQLPTEKRKNILEKIKNMECKEIIKIRDFAKFLGTITSICPAISYGWLYTKRFEREKFLALNHCSEDYDKNMNLAGYLREDFSWWKKQIMTSFNPIRNGCYSLEIFTDASLSGWGVYCDGERANGFWDTVDAKMHINYLELKAALMGLKCFCRELRNKQILLRIDNMTAISYINRMGGVQYAHLNNITRQIWQWCENRNLFIFASYIKSKDNVEADKESRNINIDTEWELSSLAYENIVNSFGLPDIDLFATHLNAKCTRYVSWKRDPYAYDIDAFTLDWSRFYFYSFPPFSLILKSLRKIINDEATGIMIVPYWPSQPWYPLLGVLSVSSPLFFGPGNDIVLSPFRTQHPLCKKLILVAYKLSGKHFKNNL